MALALTKNFDINGWKDIQEVTELPDLKAIVETNTKRFYTVDVEGAMKKLRQVGLLLQLAYSYCKGCSCSRYVLDVLSKYQDLMKDSVITTHAFVEPAVQGIKYHKLALLLADKSKPKKALMILSKCAECAGEMAMKLGNLKDTVEYLKSLSEGALFSANTNQVSLEKGKKIIERVNKIKCEKNAMESKAQGLKKQTKELWIEVETAMKDTRAHETSLGVESLFDNMFSTGKEARKKELAAKVRERELKANEERRRKQNEALNVNAEIAKAVSNLKNARVVQNEIEKIITSLELTIKILGKVKTVFLETEKFWVSVQANSEKLSAADTLETCADLNKDSFIDKIKDNGYSWLALGKINVCAALETWKVSDGIHDIMDNLPSKEEGVVLIQELATTIVGDIAEESRMIENEIAEE